VFRRISLTGSAELFKDTSHAPEYLAETDPEPLVLRPVPVISEPVSFFTYKLTESQVNALIDAVQKIKYPHILKNTAKLSMEEFERMEALRQVLLDGLR
jgi:hypothetical protein